MKWMKTRRDIDCPEHVCPLALAHRRLVEVSNLVVVAVDSGRCLFVGPTLYCLVHCIWGRLEMRTADVLPCSKLEI